MSPAMARPADALPPPAAMPAAAPGDTAVADLRQRPNFFVVGAPKAGTTSLDRLLRTHPEVFLSPIKEPCHFCPDVNHQIAAILARKRRIDMAAYLASPRREYIHLHVVDDPADYARLFEGAESRTAVGECSTFYLSSREAPARIRAYSPDARILVLVRNPLDRIRSHYAMDRALGLATRPLLAHVEEELALGDRATWANSRFYIGASRYGRQLAHYRRHFDAAAICVVAFEDLVAGPRAELARIFAFLGISTPDGPVALPRENPARAARFPWLHDGLRERGLKPFVSAMLRPAMSGPVGHFAKALYYKKRPDLVPEADLARLRQLLDDLGLGPARMEVSK